MAHRPYQTYKYWQTILLVQFFSVELCTLSLFHLLSFVLILHFSYRKNKTQELNRRHVTLRKNHLEITKIVSSTFKKFNVNALQQRKTCCRKCYLISKCGQKKIVWSWSSSLAVNLERKNQIKSDSFGSLNAKITFYLCVFPPFENEETRRD